MIAVDTGDEGAFSHASCGDLQTPRIVACLWVSGLSALVLPLASLCCVS